MQKYKHDDNGINKDIIRWFTMLVKQLRVIVGTKTGKEKLVYTFKLDSISRALDTIKKLNFEIKDGNDIKHLPRIGKGTVDRINEIIKTGKLSEINQELISGTYVEYMNELEKVFGIGHKKAHELYTTYNIKSVNELLHAYKQGTLSLPTYIVKGLKYYDQIEGKIQKDEMDKIYSILIRTGIKVDPNMDVRVCGSYRRQKKEMNDIDAIISHPDIVTMEDVKKSDLLKTFVLRLFQDKFMVDALTSINVSTKFMGVCRLKYGSTDPLRRIDLRFIPDSSYYTALLYFTGSKNFNRKMRSIAIDFGYMLNEYALLDANKIPFKISSEKQIFDLLNMEYIQPDKR